MTGCGVLLVGMVLGVLLVIVVEVAALAWTVRRRR